MRMSKREVGEVIAVIKGYGKADYQVRLPQGEVVVVPHVLINAARMTLLNKGSRLLVEHRLGQVQSATTDLQYTLSGQVKALQGGGTAYLLEPEQGGTLLVDKALIQPHPARALLPGAVLEVRLDDRRVVEARLVREEDHAVVRSISTPDGTTGTLQLRGERGGDEVTVRLPADDLRQIRVGDVLEMGISYAPDGKRKISLARPGQKAAAPVASKTPPQPNASATRAVKETSPAPGRAGALAEAEAIGLDPIELQRIKRAGHRFEIVAFLEKHARDGLIEWYRLKPGHPARHAQPARPLAPALQRAIGSALPGFSAFYQHQARALDAIRQEHNLVIVTQTASGKTLSYNPAVFEYLAAHPGGHVLYVFPLNALMMDQMEKIEALKTALAREQILISAAHLKGGMAAEERAALARSAPNILATNPEMLTFILGDAQGAWRVFFSGLKYIVIDEVHCYRGIFGVHMTGIIRRLLLAARGLGADPRFILSSATVSNPLDLAARLTSLPEAEFDLLDAEQDGSQQADKHWLVLNPDWGANSPRFGNYQEVAAEVFIEMLLRKGATGKDAPLNTILFCRSIREVKAIARLVDQRLTQRMPGLRGKVKSYVSAELTSETKRDIYEGLRSGRLCGVISTNALEAGIDIGRLDACIIAGFPFSVMALRQMAGRVGRQEEGLVLFIPFTLNSLDQYYRDHPNQLIEQPPEVFVVDPSNPYIARKHINAAALRSGLSDAELRQYWGDRAPAIARQAQQDGVMRLTGGRWQGTRRNYLDPDDTYAVASIRSNSQQPYVLCMDDGLACQASAACFAQSNRACERRITTLDRQYVYRDCHPGAVYESTDRRLYRVTALDDAQRVVRVQELLETSLERTFVEGDLSIERSGEVRGRKTILPGVEMAWGDVTVTRFFTGYFRYTLQPARRCRRCRREYDEQAAVCPACGRPTDTYFSVSKPERMDFPAPFERGFQIVLKTIACWLTLPAELETGLEPASPCKLPGERNQVLRWLQNPLQLERVPTRLRLTESEKSRISTYHQQAALQLAQTRPSPQETVLFPGVYGQCLLAALRQGGSERRALELFQALTAYPVTDELRHICRHCQTSALLPAMHTVEHAVDARYPTVALGDRSDIGAYTTLGHAATGRPTIFWFDNYEGGLGAAEKIFELFPRLLETGFEAVRSCTCSTLEGCPRCTYIPDCSEGNDGLNKPAGLALMALLAGQVYPLELRPFLYRKKRSAEFNRSYQEQETAPGEHGWGSEAPAAAAVVPHQLLRLQPRVHEIVARRAFEARSHEIEHETPPVSAALLNEAYQAVLRSSLLQEWQFQPGALSYEILEILPNASLKMIQQIYRLIALQIHPDANPGQAARATEMMKLLNAAYDQVLKEKGERRH